MQVGLPGRELRALQRRHARARGGAGVRVGGAGARPGRAPAGRAHQAAAAAAAVPSQEGPLQDAGRPGGHLHSALLHAFVQRERCARPANCKETLTLVIRIVNMSHTHQRFQ